MARKFTRRTANENNSNPNGKKTQDENKVYYPLLASATYQKGLGIVSEKAGVFTAQQNGIGDLSKVIQCMCGKTDNRESIPSVHAQTLAFEITLTEYPLDNESKTTVDQWRGALCMALLYPVLFPNNVTLVWRKGTLPEHNKFVDLAQHSRGQYPLELDALCVQQGKTTYPLLYCSDNCIIVPAAYGIESELIRLPWLRPVSQIKPESPHSVYLQVFDDPLPHLSLGELCLLRDGLRQVIQKCPGSVMVALKAFYDTVKEKVLAYQADNPHQMMEQDYLIALMLRNVVDLGLHVIRQSAQAIPDDVGAIFTSIARTLCANHNLIVVQGDKAIGFLDESNLFCSINPDDVEASEIYQQMKTYLLENLSSKDHANWNALIQYQLSRFDNFFPNAGCLLALRQRFQSPINNYALVLDWCPICAMKNEADLSDHRYFFPLKAVTLINENPQKLFSEKLLYVENDQTIYNINSIRPLYEVRIAGDKQYFIFIPAGLYGGMVLAKYNNAQLVCKYDAKSKNFAFQAVFTIVDNNITYTAVHQYSSGYMQTLDSSKLPCIALWPDVMEIAQPGEPVWSLYYLFIFFRYDRDSLQYATQVYTIDGVVVPDDSQILSVNTKEALTQWWRNYNINGYPGFIQFSHNGQSSGIMLLHNNRQQNTYHIHRIQRRMSLAIDFGTTSSIAAVRIGGNTACFIPNLENNHLTWLLNQKEGHLLSSRYFISSALCCSPSADTNGAILTALRRFESAIQRGNRKSDHVHIDGNIHYLAENFKRDEQDLEIRTGFKIMLNHDDSLSLQDSEQLTQDARLFIKQLLHMYLLYCRKQSANHVDVCFATPLALSAEEKEQLIKVFQDTTREVAEKVGLVFDQDVNVKFSTESRAVGAYFQSVRNIMNLNGRAIFTLDIGGGTSDYSFWLQDHGQITSFTCCSNRMAGHEMLSRFLYNELVAGESIDYLFDALADQAGPTAAQDNYLINLIAILRRITATTEQAAHKLDWITDQLLILYYSEFRAAFLEPRCSKLLSVMNFQLALLLWIGQVVYALTKDRLSAENVQNGVTICLAGNGSNFYRMLPQERKDLFTVVFSKMGINVDIVQQPKQRDQKTEVAKGLLMNDHIYDDAETDDDMPQRINQPEETWNDLVLYLNVYAVLYAQAFNDEIALVIQKLFQKKDRIKDIHDSFIVSVHTLSDLNQYIVQLKNKILDDAVSRVRP